MTPEEYERIKEAEKAHLRALRKLKRTLQQARRRQSLDEALDEIAASPHTLDESTALIDRLAAETALHEARLDLAIEAVREAPASKETAAKDEVEDDAMRRQRRARALLRRLKKEIDVAESSSAEPPAPSSSPPQEAPDAPPDALPQKTIGRMNDASA